MGYYEYPIGNLREVLRYNKVYVLLLLRKAGFTISIDPMRCQNDVVKKIKKIIYNIKNFIKNQ